MKALSDKILSILLNPNCNITYMHFMDIAILIKYLALLISIPQSKYSQIVLSLPNQESFVPNQGGNHCGQSEYARHLFKVKYF